MFDCIEIGPTPVDEPCEQLGPSYNPEKAKEECRIFRRQLIRQFGSPPGNAQLVVRGQDHDFGRYYEVSVKFNPNEQEEVDYAFKAESIMPEKWDNEARKEVERLEEDRTQ